MSSVREGSPTELTPFTDQTAGLIGKVLPAPRSCGARRSEALGAPRRPARNKRPLARDDAHAMPRSVPEAEPDPG